MCLTIFPLEMIRITGIIDEVDVYFYGLYGPRVVYFPVIKDHPGTIWYWVFGSRARARTHESAHKEKQ